MNNPVPSEETLEVLARAYDVARHGLVDGLDPAASQGANVTMNTLGAHYAVHVDDNHERGARLVYSARRSTNECMEAARIAREEVPVVPFYVTDDERAGATASLSTAIDLMSALVEALTALFDTFDAEHIAFSDPTAHEYRTECDLHEPNSFATHGCCCCGQDEAAHTGGA